MEKDGSIIENPMDYMPENMNEGITWKDVPEDDSTLLPMHDIISTTNAGCRNNCGWCGGSNSAFRRIYHEKNSPVFKSEEALTREFDSLKYIHDTGKFNFYSCGNYNLSDRELQSYLGKMERHHFKSINYEEYWLPSPERIKRMVDICPNTIVTLSPESSNRRISKLAGRGNYSMEEMERFIDYALEMGIHEIDIWFFIGMPEQDESAVKNDIKYCEHLLRKYKGHLVVPLICPMMPFLDPASNFFENPDKYGYKIFYRTLQQHREGMNHASIINRLNYETKWLSREQIVQCGYESIKALFMLKAEYGAIPSSIVTSLVKKLDDTIDFVKVVHKIDCIENAEDQEKELCMIEDEIFAKIRRFYLVEF